MTLANAPSENDESKSDSKSTESKLLGFAEKHGAKHPIAPAVGILIIVSILGVLLVTVGSGNNTRFFEILLMLLTVAGALYFSFFPPSILKFAGSIVGCLAVASILLNSPIPLRSVISRAVAEDYPASPPTLQSSTLKPTNESASSSRLVDLPPKTTSVKDRIVPFTAPSSYVEVGCEETQTIRIEFSLPEGATLDSTDVRWTDMNNISSSTKSVRLIERTLVAEGTLKGLPRQMILGIGNCPGGGHGTLMLTGAYKSRAS